MRGNLHTKKYHTKYVRDVEKNRSDNHGVENPNISSYPNMGRQTVIEA
jgi:hypothetical protein